MKKYHNLINALVACLLCLLSGSAVAQEVSVPKVASEKSYILGPQDVLQIDALGRTDFSTRAKIGSDGAIQLPLLGTVPAANRTTSQLRGEVTLALQKGGFFAKPIIQIEIVSYASRYVTVLGYVTTPGLIPIDRPYRLSEILARVGGVKDGGADYIVLRSSDGQVKDLLVKDLATGDSSVDPIVQPGDKIFSPRAEVFYVRGQIKAPGSYALSPDMTLQMALSKGGGLTDQGSDSDIKIIRKNAELTPKDLNMKIEPDDIIDVGQGWF